MPFKKETQVRTVFALHRQLWSLAPRFVFGIVVVLVVTLASALVFQTAKAQVRFGIGVGGIGGVLLNDSLGRQQYQQNQKAPESNSTKKTTKSRNQKPSRDKTEIAKDSSPKVKAIPEPVASAPQTTPLSAGTPPTADKFGQ
jgi:hypothetical protein